MEMQKVWQKKLSHSPCKLGQKNGEEQRWKEWLAPKSHCAFYSKDIEESLSLVPFLLKPY